LLEGAGFAVFFVAVVIAAWFGGLGPSLVALTLSLVASAWFFDAPPADAPEPAARVLFGISAFFFVGVATALLSESMRSAQRRAEAQADEAIRQREQMRTTIACIGDAVIVSDRQGRLTMMNSVAESLTGWATADAMGNRVDAIFHIRDEQSHEPLPCPVTRALHGGAAETVTPQIVLTAKDGSQRPIRQNAAPIRDEHGDVSGAVLTFCDVTQQRVREQALREADRRKDEFLAMLAHELRNPLAPICTAIDILRTDAASAAAKGRATELMGRQVHHLIRLVDDLLDVSRIMRGKIELRVESIELQSVMARAIETAQPIIASMRHELILSVPSERVMVAADPLRLAQVVNNLLSNAAKYTEPGGRIWLTGESAGDRTVIRVRDTGIGIPRDMLPRVFDLFTQVDSSMSRSQGGLGVGLTLVKRLVELNGGTVEARSDGAGKGSEFVVSLPAGTTTERADVAAHTTMSSEPVPQVKQRVLVVDDNIDAAESLAMLLRTHGHDVQVAGDGPSALEAAELRPPDIVFLDVGMPCMDGIEVGRRLRQQPSTSHAILVALTGWGLEEDRRRTRDAGFDCHLVKPVGLEVLSRVLARKGRVDETPCTDGDRVAQGA
jgi:PAS domain S-box-containing protein